MVAKLDAGLARVYEGHHDAPIPEVLAALHKELDPLVPRGMEYEDDDEELLSWAERIHQGERVRFPNRNLRQAAALARHHPPNDDPQPRSQKAHWHPFNAMYSLTFFVFLTGIFVTAAIYVGGVPRVIFILLSIVAACLLLFDVFMLTVGVWLMKRVVHAIDKRHRQDQA